MLKVLFQVLKTQRRSRFNDFAFFRVMYPKSFIVCSILPFPDGKYAEVRQMYLYYNKFKAMLGAWFAVASNVAEAC